MIGDAFQPRRRLRASQLNELARSADSAHLGASGFLSQENGLEQVARSPRRFVPPARRAGANDDGCYPAVISSEDSGVPGVYAATLYTGGIGSGSGTTIDLVLTEFGQEMGLPQGTIVLAHPIGVRAADDGGDSEE